MTVNRDRGHFFATWPLRTRIERIGWGTPSPRHSDGYRTRGMRSKMRRTNLAVVVVLCLVAFRPSTVCAEVPQWVSFPGKQWETMTPQQAGLDTKKFNAWVRSRTPKFGRAYGGQKPGKGGVVIARGGFILHTWGDSDFKYQSASLGKTFTRMALQLAVDDGLIKSHNDFVKDYWSGEELLPKHKVMTNGHNAKVKFLHLQNMRAGFPVSNGFFWKNKRSIPAWAKHTGDPNHDNYAHVAPGNQSRYSSGGYWRLSQALTAIWKKDLKQLLDERIMSKIGIPADRWNWLTGEQVRTQSVIVLNG